MMNLNKKDTVYYILRMFTLNENDIKLKDFKYICRICLQKTINLHNIKDVAFEESISLTLILNKLFELDVNNNDLPTQICDACKEHFKQIYLFKKHCQTNETILNTVLETHVEEVEHVSDVESLEKVVENVETVTEIPKEIRKENVKPLERDTEKKISFKTHICPYCYQQFSERRLYLQHLRVIQHPNKYRCKTCLKEFKYYTAYKRHEKIHTNERPHICDLCGKGFIQLVTLQAHINAHNRCTNRTQRTREISHNIKCLICEQTFSTFTGLTIHNKRKHNKINEKNCKYVCDVCGQYFCTTLTLKHHKATHNTERNFLCNVCGKQFRNKIPLTTHMRVHTKERPYNCNICLKWLSSKTSLYFHMLRHKNIRPYKCNVCGKKFTQRAHLVHHKRGHTGEKPYACSFCDKRFMSKTSLTVHVRRHTGEVLHNCTECGKEFFDKRSFQKHEKIHAKVEEDHYNSFSCRTVGLLSPFIFEIELFY